MAQRLRILQLGQVVVRQTDGADLARLFKVQQFLTVFFDTVKECLKLGNL